VAWSRIKSQVTLTAVAGLTFSCLLNAQDATPGVPQSTPPVSQPAAQVDRPISPGRIVPNILEDQTKIWTFPARLNKKRNWIPTALILGTTAALIATDPYSGPHFQHTSTFSGFNSVFSGTATTAGILAAPAALYVGGLASKDSKMTGTALLAAESLADSEILAYVLKVSFKRVRPHTLSSGDNYWDTWFESPGPFLNGTGGMPSGHTIAAFSVATIVARRYGNHRWVPFVSYGLAALVGLSRATLSEHFLADVFVGGALGYSVSRFAVLQQ
jgi:membrane-associated phospholipid phosphatase